MYGRRWGWHARPGTSWSDRASQALALLDPKAPLFGDLTKYSASHGREVPNAQRKLEQSCSFAFWSRCKSNHFFASPNRVLPHRNQSHSLYHGLFRLPVLIFHVWLSTFWNRNFCLGFLCLFWFSFLVFFILEQTFLVMTQCSDLWKALWFSAVFDRRLPNLTYESLMLLSSFAMGVRFPRIAFSLTSQNWLRSWVSGVCLALEREMKLISKISSPTPLFRPSDRASIVANSVRLDWCISHRAGFSLFQHWQWRCESWLAFFCCTLESSAAPLCCTYVI